MPNPFVKSIGENDHEILSGIMMLHCPEGFELDATYSIGRFYEKGLKQPVFKYDLNPKVEGVIQADCKSLPHENNSIKSIVFDPPFMFGNHGKQAEYSATVRYTMFKTYDELFDMYEKAIFEFYRILQPKGILVFKCQDFTDSKTSMLHCLVYNMAVKHGFYAKDILILTNTFKIVNTTLIQRHARKFHSYFWVFQK